MNATRMQVMADDGLLGTGIRTFPIPGSAS